MARKYRKLDEDFKQGAVQLVVETGSRSRRWPGIWASTRAPWATGAPRSVGQGRRTAHWIRTSGPSLRGCVAR
jgi:hypothetical protein